MPRQLNGLPANSLRFATGNFQQPLKENCCDTDPKRISSVRDDQNRHMGARCLEHFEGSEPVIDARLTIAHEMLQFVAYMGTIG
jgi:hypothetical protein